MVGIINGQMQAKQEMPEDQAMPEEMPMEQEGDADPEMQAMYDKVIAAAGRLLYDEAGSQAIIEQMKKSANDPASVIAAVTVSIMATISEKSGGKLTAEIILPALEEVAELVAELGQESKSIKVDDSVLQAVSTELVAQAIQAQIITPEMIQAELDGVDESELQGIMAQFQGGA